MILGICDLPETMKVMRIINIVIWIIRIAVPVLLIVSGSLDYAKQVKEAQIDISATNKKFIKRLAAAAIIFMIPTFVNIITKLTGINEYTDCLKVTNEDISVAYQTTMEKYISAARESKNRTDYSTAVQYLRNFSGEEKEKYYNELKEIEEEIIADEAAKRKENAKSADETTSESGSYTTDTNPGASSNTGKDVVVNDKVKEACKWVLNPTSYILRIQTCSDKYQYSKETATSSLPGGGYEYTTPYGKTNYRATNTITFLDYEYGVFGGEITLYNTDSYNDIFATMYKTFFLKHAVDGYAFDKALTSGETAPNSNGEYPVVTGSCFQNYRYELITSYMNNATYKNTMTSTIDRTKYYILVDSVTGGLIDCRYNTTSGILPIITSVSKTGTKEDILYAIGHQQNTFMSNYQNAVFYDCRNLQ